MRRQMTGPDYTNIMRRHAATLNPVWMTPAPLGDKDLMMTRVNEHLALGALAGWSGTPIDLQVLQHAVAVARALCSLGYGADELPAVSRAAAALTKCKLMRPHSMGMQPDDLAAVRDLVRLIEAQRAVAPAKDYAKALLCCSR
jgi:hypothetical protein